MQKSIKDLMGLMATIAAIIPSSSPPSSPTFVVEDPPDPTPPPTVMRYTPSRLFPFAKKKKWCGRCRDTGDIGNGRVCPYCKKQRQEEADEY